MERVHARAGELFTLGRRQERLDPGGDIPRERCVRGLVLGDATHGVAKLRALRSARLIVGDERAVRLADASLDGVLERHREHRPRRQRRDRERLRRRPEAPHEAFHDLGVPRFVVAASPCASDELLRSAESRELVGETLEGHHARRLEVRRLREEGSEAALTFLMRPRDETIGAPPADTRRFARHGVILLQRDDAVDRDRVPLPTARATPAIAGIGEELRELPPGVRLQHATASTDELDVTGRVDGRDELAQLGLRGRDLEAISEARDEIGDDSRRRHPAPGHA